jgi:hypothetical protein
VTRITGTETGNPYTLSEVNWTSATGFVGHDPVLWAEDSPVAGQNVTFVVLGDGGVNGTLDIGGGQITTPLATNADGLGTVTVTLPSDPPGTSKVAVWSGGALTSNTVTFELQ